MADCEQPRVPEPTRMRLSRATSPSREAIAGWLLTRVVIAAAVWVVLGAAACGVLALLGIWQPVVAAVVLLLLALLAARLSRPQPARPMPVWSMVAVTTVALAATLWAGHALRAGAAAPRRRQQPPGRDRAWPRVTRARSPWRPTVWAGPRSSPSRA